MATTTDHVFSPAQNLSRIDPLVHPVLEALLAGLLNILHERLCGIYIHGSLAMGCFNPATSDIDVLIVVSDSLEVSYKKRVMALFHELSDHAPAKGFELSVITQEALSHFEHPTPFELHFATSRKEDFLEGKVNYDIKEKDPDLAAHLTVTLNRGIPIYGPPAPDILPRIPDEHYLDSIAKDAEWSFRNIEGGPDSGLCRVPVYGVLNYCRVIAFIQERTITSKKEGAEWGLKHLPDRYRDLIESALSGYLSGTAPDVDAALLKDFSRYAIGRIREVNQHSAWD